MQILGVPPGRVVGRAYQHLLELRMEHGPLGTERATQELLAWAVAEGLSGLEGSDPGRQPPGA
jgi:poly(A) polymerase